ncbi:hypothetical protein ACFL1Q_01565 [Patescibacteria group bacterium]
MLKKALKHFSVSSLIFILFGALTWVITMVKSGWVYSYGMGFWGPNGHDGVWHIALSESLGRGSLNNPVFAGMPLQNYHLGFDIFLAILNKLTRIPTVNLYFQILPIIFAIFVGVLSYKFILEWVKSKKTAVWAVFFVYFGGSFAWILGRGESAFWSQAAISTLINPPYVLSLIFILSGLIFLLKYQKLGKVIYLLLSVLFFGLLVEVKIYAGILVLGGLLAGGVFEYLLMRRFRIFWVFVGVLLVSLAFIFPSLKDSSELLVFQPFWFLETMIGLSDRVGWERFYSAMVNYRAGGVWLKAVLTYSFAFILFIIGNAGTRILAFKRLKIISGIDAFVWSIIAAGVVIPMFFLQKGTPWNTIQFFYYSLFFLGIMAAVTISKINNRYLLATLVILTIPTTALTLRDIYLPSRPPAMLSVQELEALKYLKDRPQGVVLTYPFDKLAAKEAETNPPRPLYLYESTAYVSAFSGKDVFLEDEVNLNITGYDWKLRRQEIEEWYNQSNQEKAREFLNKNNIKYVYWLKGQRGYLGETQLGIDRIFENEKVDIYMVKS